MKAKEKYRLKILEIIGDPANAPCLRTELAQKLGISQRNLYKAFRPEELDAIEEEALAVRRTQYSRYMVAVDRALLQKAAEGDVAACKLCYQRFEGWSEKQKREHAVDNSLARLPRELDGRTRLLLKLNR